VTNSEKIMAGICVLSLLCGLLQHKMMKEKESSVEGFKALADGSLKKNNSSRLAPLHHEPRRALPRDSSISRHEEKHNAIKKRLAYDGPPPVVVLPPEFDAFAVREAMKQQAFSVDGSNSTVRQERMMEIIESGKIAF